MCEAQDSISRNFWLIKSAHLDTNSKRQHGRKNQPQLHTAVRGRHGAHVQEKGELDRAVGSCPCSTPGQNPHTGSVFENHSHSLELVPISSVKRQHGILLKVKPAENGYSFQRLDRVGQKKRTDPKDFN